MPILLVSVLVPCNILLSFDFVAYSRPGFVIVLVFLVPHIMLVYLAFFIVIYFAEFVTSRPLLFYFFYV